ncbi:MAG: hypothetical protein PHE26_00985 [Syntrophomonadaceae bacterium]|nr:hypothetical protein [Syntrophomonadaceae bacterium]
MEDRLYLMRSDRLVLGTETWLVLQNTGEYSIIIKLKTNKLELMRLRTEEIVYKIVRKEALLELNKVTSNKLLDSETLPPNQQVNYNKAKEICGFLSNYSISLDWLLYRPERAEVIKMIVDKYQVSDDTVRRYILHYFQGGMNATALLPKYNNCGKVDKRIYTDKKPGKKGISIMPRDEKMEKIFSIMTSRYMASGAKISLTKLYDEMIGEFYSVKNQSYWSAIIKVES